MKILAIDEDRRSALLLEQHCRSILASRLEHFTAVDSCETAGTKLQETLFDVVLLDPGLPRGDGLNWLAARNGQAFQTIVISAHTDLAMRAFEFGVLDFVQKPATLERLAKALCRVMPPAAPNITEQFLAVRRFGRIDLVAIDDLLYVEGSDKYSELVLASGQRNFYDKCLGRVEAVLPRSFVRIHKSYLVRFKMISRLIVQRGSRYSAELKNGQRLPVGRSRYAHVKSLLV